MLIRQQGLSKTTKYLTMITSIIIIFSIVIFGQACQELNSTVQGNPPTPTYTASIATPTPEPTLAPTPTVASLYSPRERFGVSAVSNGRYPLEEELEQLNIGWYLDWAVRLERKPSFVEYAPMLQLSRQRKIHPNLAAITKLAKEYPGQLWLVGNEPDVIWQNDVLPQDYALLYHQIYDALKTADPTCQIAIGGVAQPSPLRRRYLEKVLKAYQKEYGERMPVDVWNIHNFILREERDGWGVDIPPGITDDIGLLYEIDDSDNIEAFKQHIIEFRRWMVEQGYDNHPLIITEFGVLMPPEYGFPPERVIKFMNASFDFLMTAKDEETGYAADEYRLVQRWVWYSTYDTLYPSGNLIDIETGGLTEMGQAFVDYLEKVTHER